MTTVTAGITDPHDERAGLIEALVTSGASVEPWTQGALMEFERWRDYRGADLATRVAFDGVKCFAAGCMVNVEYSNEAAYEQCSQAIFEAALSSVWGGPSIRTAPEKSQDGRVSNTWILVRPDAL